MMPTPDWARCHVEIYEAPGWLDDCFRSGWTKFQSAASESFVNAGGVSGDYATMTVTEGGTPSGCGYRKDISSLNLSTDTYPLIRVRLRGRNTTPRYRVAVEYTDSSETDSGWIDAPTGFDVKALELASGKTVKYVKLYAKSNTASSTACIDYDYAAILKNPPLIPAEVEEVDVDLQTTTAVSGLRLWLLNDPLLGVAVLRLPFDENHGTKAYDLSRHLNHGAIQGATWVDGKFGKALDFDGLNDNVNCGNDSSLNVRNNFTVVAWIKPRGKGEGNYGRIFDKEKVQMFMNNGQNVLFRVKKGGANKDAWTSGGVVTFGDWHHIAGVYDGANIIIYHNGVKYVGAAVTGDIDDHLALDLYVGDRQANDRCFDGLIDEFRIYSRALTADEIYKLYVNHPLSGAARACVGNLAMVYLASADENLVYKLVTARVIDREVSGDPDDPTVELIGEDLGEILHERTFTHEYASARWISGVVEDVVTDSVPELEKDVDQTDRTIINKFKDEGVWSLLQKMAEAAHFDTGESGANFYVDPGGALRFKKYGAFTCSHAVSDGSDGSPANILDIAVRETIKGNPRLANDVKVIIFEEESVPKDEDSWTESADSWSSPDPTDAGYPQSDTGDKQSGTASIHFNTTNPGSQYRMRHVFDEVDISDLDQIKFWFKHGAGLSPEQLEVRMQKGVWTWTTDYYVKSGISVPADDTWGEITVDISGMTKGGNPGKIVDHLHIRPFRTVGDLGVGGFLVDKLRFIRSEKAGTASDATSQSNYGKRTLREVDKTITNVDYAGYVAGNIVAHRKNPLVTVQATVPGRGQLGYRPPMVATVTSLKDGVDRESFQIQRVRHLYKPGEGYVCDLELVAARKPDGAYEPKVAPAVLELGAVLALLRRRQMEKQLNAVRTRWE